MFSIIPSGYMLTAAQDLPQVADQYQKDSGLSHSRNAYERFVQQVSSSILLVSPILHLYDYANTFDSFIQEAEHVPPIGIDEKKWTSTSQLWSLRWATMPLEEKCLYDAQAGSDK
jgi:hypothetical protein